MSCWPNGCSTWVRYSSMFCQSDHEFESFLKHEKILSWTFPYHNLIYFESFDSHLKSIIVLKNAMKMTSTTNFFVVEPHHAKNENPPTWEIEVTS